MNSLATKVPKPPPLKNQVKVTSGPTADKLTNKTILEIDLNKVNTAEDLRKAITADGFMQNGDAFLLPPDNFTIAKSVEASLPWTKLKDERTKAIGIISQPPKKKENLAVPTLPQTTKSWEPKIGGGFLLPDLPTTKIAENNQVVPLINAVDLGIEEWAYLIRLNNLFHGVRMGTGSADDDNGPEYSPYTLIEPPESLFWISDDRAGVEITTLYSERNTTYVRQGWVKATATFSSPYASASVEASHQEMTARQSAEKQIFVTGVYRYQRAILEFDPSKIVLSKAFLHELDDILDQQELDRETTVKVQRERLHILFEKWGHVFPLRIALGALLVTTQDSVDKVEGDQRRTENSVKAALNFAVGVYQGSASVEVGSKNESGVEQKSGWASNTFSVKGGDSLQLTTVSKWIPTVAPFKNWRVIKTEKIIDIRELLSEPRYSRVKELDPTPKPLTACWVDVDTSVSDKGSGTETNLVVGQPPHFPPTQPGSSPWCWVGQTFQPYQSKTKKILIVRENVKGALGPMKGTLQNWAKDNKYYIGTPIPVDAINYVALGSYFSQHAQLTEGPEPNWTEPKYKWDQLVAVRRDLCVQARYSENSWNDANAGGGVQNGSVWEIVPKDGDGLALELFGGSNLTGHNKPTRTPWTIRSDVVEWVAWN